MQVPFQIEGTKNKMLLGVLHIPNQIPTPCQVVIMCYGMNGNRVDNNRISRDFGVACEKSEIVYCRFDYAGLGISEGEFYEADLFTKVNDCVAVIDFIKGCIGSDKINIALIGFSDGVRLIANLLPRTRFDKLIFWSPLFYTERAYVDSRIGKKMLREPATGVVVFPFKGIFISAKHLRQQMSLQNELEALEPYLNDSALIIFGENDPAVIKIFRELQNSNFSQFKNVKYIANADHLYSRKQWKEQLFELTINFLKGN
jgi:alpha/beta superfamily hydrolase